MTRDDRRPDAKDRSAKDHGEKPTRREFLRRAAVLTGGAAAGSASSPAGARASSLAAGGAFTPGAAESGAPSRSAPASRPARLRALLESPGTELVPEAYSVFAARLAELHDFRAVYIGGNMMAGLHLGIDDWGLIDIAEMVEIGGRIARGVSVPTLVDADQGGETSLNVYRAVRMYERAGIAGFHIEDTRNPKHLGAGTSELMPVEEMQERVAAAVEARTDPDFVVVARTDAMILGGAADNSGEMIRRGQAFAEAGADAFFPVAIPGSLTPRIAREVPVPVVGLNIPLEEVPDGGLSLDIHAVSVYPAAMKLYETMILELKEDGDLSIGEDRRLSRETMARVLRSGEYRELVDRWRVLRG